MKRNLKVVFAVLAVAVTLFAFGYTQDSQNVNQPAQKTAENSRIAQAVREALQKDESVSPFKIDVDVADGVVSLRGRVPTQQAADRVQELAEQVKGVRAVRSFLKIGDDDPS